MYPPEISPVFKVVGKNDPNLIVFIWLRQGTQTHFFMFYVQKTAPFIKQIYIRNLQIS